MVCEFFLGGVRERFFFGGVRERFFGGGQGALLGGGSGSALGGVRERFGGSGSAFFWGGVRERLGGVRERFWRFCTNSVYPRNSTTWLNSVSWVGWGPPHPTPSGPDRHGRKRKRGASQGKKRIPTYKSTKDLAYLELVRVWWIVFVSNH